METVESELKDDVKKMKFSRYFDEVDTGSKEEVRVRNHRVLIQLRIIVVGDQ